MAWQAVCGGAVLHSLTCNCALLQASRGLAGRLWAAYTRQLDVRPVLTKSLTSFTGFVVGDAIAQVSTGEKYNYWRTARFAAYGFCIHAPRLPRVVWPAGPERDGQGAHQVGPGWPRSAAALSARIIWGVDRQLYTLGA